MSGPNPTFERLAMSLTENGARAAIRIIFQLSTDAELARAIGRASEDAIDPLRDLLVVELERRGLEA
ncbi:hypothetical protein SAMN06297144_1180 [Sphingomonas guangdongensis]|uniref:Uncharacterized protein n=1 Tax=Sphingomonas guangdongensis TaxID=1141890 RepID=A0A285QFH1_9SPHN|nr:hypothetical protein SAMN06297144_1180 [Sphingomonas guangdongensis]